MIVFEKCIVVLAGLPLTGKSTLGKELSEQSNLVYFDVEIARREIERSGSWLGQEKEKQIMLSAYKRNHQWAKTKLSEGQPVVLAATYSRLEYHQMLSQLSQEASVPLKFFLLVCPESVLLERLKSRPMDSTSNIRTYEQFYSVKERYQRFQEIEASEIDTSLPIKKCVEKVFSELKKFKLFR